MNKIFLFLFALSVAACVAETSDGSSIIESKPKLTVNQFDTLTVMNADYSSNFIKRYSYQTKTSTGLPKNEIITFNIDYRKNLKRIMDHADVVLKSLDSNFIIQKINDSTFQFRINEACSNEVIRYNVFAVPHENYAVDSYYAKKTIQHPDTILLCQFAEMVEK